MVSDLDGRLAVVSGAGGDIGRCIAAELNRLGMRLALLDIDEAGMARTRQSLDRPGECSSHVTDVGVESAVDETARQIVADAGLPTVVVNCAGRLGPSDRRSWDVPMAVWQDLCAVNLFGAVHLVRAFLPGMLARGEPGHIVNVSSMAGVVGPARLGPYGASKFALRAFTETLARELADEAASIGVSGVYPGPVATELNREFRDRAHARGELATTDPWLSPEDVAAQVVDAVLSGREHVFTHPGSMDRITRYHRWIEAT